jgi:hypothetical protein
MRRRSASQTHLDRLGFGVSARFFVVDEQLQQYLDASDGKRFFV